MMTTNTSCKILLRGLPSLKGPFRDCDLTELPNTPHAAFELWLQDAIDQGVKEPHAMTLSTVDADGFADARVLILKNVDHRGWHFAIKGDSPKGVQINASPNVALTFYWPVLGRQIRIRGRANELPRSESAEDFLGRPVGSRVTAIASAQSSVMQDRTDFDERIVKAQSLIENEPEHVSSAWRVFAVAPQKVEFWQGATDRLHQRLQFEKHADDGNWVRNVLYP